MSEEAGSSPVERFLKFLEAVANDPDLEDRVAALEQGDTAGLLAIAAEKGYYFTFEEFKSAVRELNGDGKTPDEPRAKAKLPGNKMPLPLTINRTRSLNGKAHNESIE